MHKGRHTRRRGQLMILSVITIGATLLGATAIAGILLIYQIRQTTEFENSARAIAAADAGVEYGEYNFFCSGLGRSPCPIVTSTVTFTNGARFLVSSPTATSVKSTGYFGNTKRAFLVDLTAATATVP